MSPRPDEWDDEPLVRDDGSLMYVGRYLPREPAPEDPNQED